MKRIQFGQVAAAATALLILGGCGGGGGSGGGFAALPLPAAVTSASVASVTLSGTASYDSVPNTSGPLAYSGTTSKPIRGAVVEILDASSAVVASTITNASGVYSVSVPGSASLMVRVKAQMTQAGSGATWDVTVRDNTQSNAIYAMESPAFTTSGQPVTRDVHAPSGWGGTSYTGTRVAAPFAVLDTIYDTQAKVLSVSPTTQFPALRVFWSVNNRPASGDPAIGQIGTTSFSSGSSGSAIYVLGQENVDTDEYDSSVIAHEWGHYYQAAFSRDDSPGGSHAMTDRLDRRVAFSEGWGNAWSGIALARGNYTDAVGPAQSQGSNVDLTTGAATTPGWYRESSIQSIFWNLNSRVGFKPIHDAMTGAFKNGLAVTSIHPFTAAFNAATPGSFSVLAGLLTSQNISSAPNDPYGTLETNDGGVTGSAGSLPMYRSATVGGSTSACVTNQADPTLAGNKLGSYVYLTFAVPTARNYAITVAGPSGSDPDFGVYGGRLIAEANAVGPTESATVSLQAGSFVLAINDYNNSSASTCFTVTIQ